MKLLSKAALPFLVLSFAAAQAATKTPSAHWLDPIPSASRATAVKSLRALLTAESRRDWPAVYQLRPDLDKESESEGEFERRWTEGSKGTVLDFQPQRTVPSTFGYEAEGEQAFDILGCTKVKDGDGTRYQLGSVSAHLTSYGWALDGVHLMTDDDDKPEPCTFHAGAALLAAKSR